MTLVKHAARTIRKGCQQCGSTDLYWAHDTTKHADRDCDRCGLNGAFVLVDATPEVQRIGTGETVPDYALHANTCTGKRESKQQDDGESIPAPESKPEAPSKPAPSPAPATMPAPGTDAFSAFMALFQQMAPSVDMAEVERMVSAKVDTIVFPHTTVVERPEREPFEIQGAHVALPSVLRKLMAKRHVMMVGPAGTGKSHLAESAAHALELSFRFIACHPAMTPTALIGFIDAGGTYRGTAFREVYENGGVFLFDEIDNSNPSILASMNAALANGHMEFPDGIVKRHPDFKCVAAANTYGRGADRSYVGRQQLDAATLDRFAVVDVDYDESLEHSLCLATGLESTEVDRVLTTLRKIRRSARDKGMRVIVSLRATVGTCELLLAGDTFDECLESLVYKGMSSADRSKLNA